MPLGEWRYDEDSGAWIFDPFVPLVGLPQTGANILMHYLLALCGFSLLSTGLIIRRSKGCRGDY